MLLERQLTAPPAGSPLAEQGGRLDRSAAVARADLSAVPALFYRLTRSHSAAVSSVVSSY